MNIYVGNLAFALTEEELREAFGNYGTVESVKVMTDKFTGKSKGFGFVEMPDAEQAKAAISGLDGKDLKGRALKVSEARPREEGGSRGFERGGRGGGGGYGGGGHRGGGGSGGGRRSW
ncbi:MAG: RNA-binding protein [Deltaproteobacteria bacterium]|nr:RNA-binding protein [Deltaproteobacteria bacterium]